MYAMCRASLSGRISENMQELFEVSDRLVGLDIRNFDKLNNIVAEIEMHLAEKRNIAASSSSESELHDKKSIDT